MGVELEAIGAGHDDFEVGPCVGHELFAIVLVAPAAYVEVGVVAIFVGEIVGVAGEFVTGGEHCAVIFPLFGIGAVVDTPCRPVPPAVVMPVVNREVERSGVEHPLLDDEEVGVVAVLLHACHYRFVDRAIVAEAAEGAD